MKLFSRCDRCRKLKLLVKRRYFWTKGINLRVTSRSLLCGGCARGIKKQLPPHEIYKGFDLVAYIISIWKNL